MEVGDKANEGSAFTIDEREREREYVQECVREGEEGLRRSKRERQRESRFCERERGPGLR